MNLTRDIEALKECRTYFKWWPKWAAKAMESPMFMLDSTSPIAKEYQADTELLEQLWGEDKCIRLPFQNLRIYCPKEPGDPCPSHWHLVKPSPGKLEIVTAKVNTEFNRHEAFYRQIGIGGIEEVAPGQKPKHATMVSGPSFNDTDKTVKVFSYAMLDFKFGIYGKYQDAAGSITSNDLRSKLNADGAGFMDFVIHFAYEMAYPSNHLVKVSPNTPGKSVQWTAARTHYVMIPTRGIQESQRGGTKRQVNDVITRCAHERRAHLRRLTSEKFLRTDDGRVRTIWVKDTWVGPIEWKSPDAVSIYKIVSPESL